MAKNKKEKKKNVYIDDGHTVYDMSGLDKSKSKSDDGVQMTKKEKRAAVRAAFERFLPIFIGVLLCFTATMLLIRLWLS